MPLRCTLLRCAALLLAQCVMLRALASTFPPRHTLGGAGGLPSFQQLVQSAVAQGLGYVRLPPRVERSVPTLDKNVHLVIHGARDLVIDGTGATLLATTLTRASVCHSVHLAAIA